MPRRPTAAVVLGLDPGLAKTGYAAVRRSARPSLIDAGVLRSRPSDPLEVRVAELCDDLRGLLAEFSPSASGLEAVFANPRNFASSLKLAQCRGGLAATLSAGGVPVFSVAPTRVKAWAAGSGRASKADVQRAVKAELRLPRVLKPNDAADAAAIALCVPASVFTPLSPGPPAGD